MKITVHAHILSGNLGEGWSDVNEAAQALADYSELVWRDDLSDFVKAGHSIEFNINVQRNTGGVPRPLSVEVIGESLELTRDTSVEAVRALTDENVIWARFCAGL